jgi:predicted 3-demethylubiquinone-9 3-methyltransferase (glyoxalase superfamily)
MTTKPLIQPCLWFDRQAEEAARFSVSVFPHSRIGAITHDGPGGHLPEGTVLAIDFELDGQTHTALNGGPHFKCSPARHRGPAACLRPPLSTHQGAPHAIHDHRQIL